MRNGTRLTQAARRTLIAALFLVVAPGSASAQTPDLVTDRPDQTESATVVLRGLVQVETGYLFARDDGIDVFEVPARSCASALEPVPSCGSGTRRHRQQGTPRGGRQ